MRSQRKRSRIYRFRPGKYAPLRRALLVLCAVVLVISLWQLGDYILQYRRSVKLSAELREAYIAALQEEATQAPLAATQTLTAEPASGQTTPEPADEQPAETPAALDPLGTLPPQPYSMNPYRLISNRFQKLRRQNVDIVGWLTIGDLLSEAVVQRDNAYYLRRDYRGYHNDNGAIFLDEACSLQNRPYTYTLYGHNMKTGAMFGCLRNYENASFYRKNPFIHFDTIYEDGCYVIFSIAEVSINTRDINYSGFYRLNSCTILEREAIIKRLSVLSKHTNVIDVNADDQLLLLVTCVGDEDDRRVVAARRLRDDETEAGVYQRIQQVRGQ